MLLILCLSQDALLSLNRLIDDEDVRGNPPIGVAASVSGGVMRFPPGNVASPDGRTDGRGQVKVSSPALRSLPPSLR